MTFYRIFNSIRGEPYKGVNGSYFHHLICIGKEVKKRIVSEEVDECVSTCRDLRTTSKLITTKKKLAK